ncbi:hypothetical protein FSARC_8817 [Fusarium sarcochroum]|uniref:Uncharacterized protein n=1 Tax=Fusarium sarcochroum TaxID=1208366 RepID=A0A8H4TS48_9HYPO|nr:hypothetical protein FSARC_8817 [Fusarium sarcochroum]
MRAAIRARTLTSTRIPSPNSLAKSWPYLKRPSPYTKGTRVLAHANHRCLASVSASQSFSPKDRPLDGITVVSLEQAIAAPFCTRQLADLGARVIKVERPGTGDFCRHYDTRVDGMCSHFVWVNRNKESLALDLKIRKDLEVLFRLIEKADVLVQNLAPGAAARMGLSYEALKENHPSLIVCDISGYGQNGPYRDKKAYDLLVQSEAGMLSVTGTKTEPAKVGISVADIAAAMYAYSNILSAIIQRSKTGKGRAIDISMLESMVEWMGFPMYYAYNGAPGPSPNGASHASIYPYGPFEVANGESVMLGIQNEREWVSFCHKVLLTPNLSSDERFITNSLRVQNSTLLKSIIHETFSKMTTVEVTERLEEAAIANAKVNQLKDVWDHPQLQARERWAELMTPGGPVPAMVPPGWENGKEARMDAVPEIGAHNESILAELGMDNFGSSISSDKR